MASRQLCLRRRTLHLSHSISQLRPADSIWSWEKQFPYKKSDNIIKTVSSQLDPCWLFNEASRVTFKMNLAIWDLADGMALQEGWPFMSSLNGLWFPYWHIMVDRQGVENLYQLGSYPCSITRFLPRYLTFFSPGFPICTMGITAIIWGLSCDRLYQIYSCP